MTVTGSRLTGRFLYDFKVTSGTRMTIAFNSSSVSETLVTSICGRESGVKFSSLMTILYAPGRTSLMAVSYHLLGLMRAFNIASGALPGRKPSILISFASFANAFFKAFDHSSCENVIMTSTREFSSFFNVCCIKGTSFYGFFHQLFNYTTFT